MQIQQMEIWVKPVFIARDCHLHFKYRSMTQNLFSHLFTTDLTNNFTSLVFSEKSKPENL